MQMYALFPVCNLYFLVFQVAPFSLSLLGVAFVAIALTFCNSFKLYYLYESVLQISACYENLQRPPSLFVICIYTTPSQLRFCAVRVRQNRTYTPCMTVYLAISLPKIPYIHCSGQLYV
jgi:hypothetical protein